MNNNRGFTLVELIIAVTIVLIVSLGFFGWASTIIQTNLSIERNNTAYAMLLDVAEKLQRMSDNSLILHTTTRKCVGHASSGTYAIGECRNIADSAIDCINGDPTKTNSNLSPDTTGMTKYTNPTKDSITPYLYDKNNCEGKTWLDTDCGGTSTSTITAANKVTVTTSANSNIDHPDPSKVVSTYNSINPIRSYKNTTYYAVWSVAYLPCNAGTTTDRRKIFITVYWFDPEPTGTTAGTATVKSVSIVVDKVIGTES